MRCLSKTNTTKAKVHYQMALAMKPDLAVTLNNLGAIYAKEEQFEEARQYYKQAIEVQADYTEAYHNLGNSHMAERDPQSALPYFEHAIQQRPEFQETRLELAKALLALRNFKEALKHLKRLHSEQYLPTEVLPLIAGAHLFNGNRSQAIAQYETLLKIDPRNRRCPSGARPSLSAKQTV